MRHVHSTAHGIGWNFHRIAAVLVFAATQKMGKNRIIAAGCRACRLWFIHRQSADLFAIAAAYGTTILRRTVDIPTPTRTIV